MATNPLASLFRRAPQIPLYPPSFPYKITQNPYRAKKAWPPDFTHLSPAHQFRLERRYKRRAKLKWARPNWNKGVQLAQWGAIGFVVVYGVFFLEMGAEGQRRRTVFDGAREWYGRQVGVLKGARDGGVVKEGDGGEG